MYPLKSHFYIAKLVCRGIRGGSTCTHSLYRKIAKQFLLKIFNFYNLGKNLYSTWACFRNDCLPHLDMLSEWFTSMQISPAIFCYKTNPLSFKDYIYLNWRYVLISYEVTQNILKYCFCFSDKFRQACYNWVCGDTKQAEMHISKEERDLLRQKMTSIRQNERWGIVLNMSAGFLVIAITFLFGYFA